MLYDSINKQIADALAQRMNKNASESDRQKADILLSTLRLIKAKYLEHQTSDSKGDKTITEAVEVNILRKMLSERKDDLGMFLAAGRDELAEKTKYEISIIEKYLPAAITEEQIIAAYDEVLRSGIEPIRKNMGMFIKTIKEKYPTADGKLISTIVSQRLK